MFELILNTIKDNLIKIKQEIISDIRFAQGRDTAEIRCDLLEIKQLLKQHKIPGLTLSKDLAESMYYKNRKHKGSL